MAEMTFTPDGWVDMETGIKLPYKNVDGKPIPFNNRVPGFMTFVDIDVPKNSVSGRPQVQYFVLENGKRVNVKGGNWQPVKIGTPQASKPGGYISSASGIHQMVPGERLYPMPDHHPMRTAEETKKKGIKKVFDMVQKVVGNLAQKVGGAATFLPLGAFAPFMIVALKRKGVDTKLSEGMPKMAGKFYTHVIAKNNLEHAEGAEIVSAAAQLAGSTAGATVGIPPQVSQAIIKRIIDFITGVLKKTRDVPVTKDELKALGTMVIDKTLGDLAQEGMDKTVAEHEAAGASYDKSEQGGISPPSGHPKFKKAPVHRATWLERKFPAYWAKRRNTITPREVKDLAAKITANSFVDAKDAPEMVKEWENRLFYIRLTRKEYERLEKITDKKEGNWSKDEGEFVRGLLARLPQ